MPKKKKTLKQKLTADMRRGHEREHLYSFQHPDNLTQQLQPIRELPSHHAISTVQHQYLATDLWKTTLFTGFVVLSELVLYYFL